MVAIAEPRHESHFWSYVALFSGAALVGGSFVLGDKADDTYAEYLAETDPAKIDDLYDKTVLYDRLSTGSLITGEILLVGGIYLRFLRSPPSQRVSLTIGPRRCGLAYHF